MLPGNTAAIAVVTDVSMTGLESRTHELADFVNQSEILLI